MISRRAFTVLGAGAALTSMTGLPAAQATPRGVRDVVLVHGAYADGSCFAAVIEGLQDAGLRVSSVQNPLTSLAEDVAATNRVLDELTGPAVLAGHSWGGAVITQAGLHRNVAGLVYLAARAPEVNEDYAALAARFPTPPANAGIIESGGFRRLTETAFLRDFAVDVPHRQARALYAAQGRVAATLFASRTSVAAWRSRPSWYAVSRRDRTTAPELQRFVAQRMGARTVELDTGHLAPVSRPAAVTRLIRTAAAQLG
ncbi:alpha/beta fold hydrolase [Crossiella sp. CA198]|uniref:alpha/beta fold hydrolase n=1 Tax=Crossiella sp. CA198 TaxID=3455607 RepID=UPI003F8D76B8